MSTKIKKRNSLFIRLPLFIVIIIIIMGSISLLLLKSTMKSRAMDRISEMSSMTLTSLDWSVASLINAGDRKSLQRLMENAGANRMMSDLGVCSVDNRVIASSIPGEVGRFCRLDVVNDVLRDNMLISRRTAPDGSFETAIPVKGHAYDNTSKSSILAVLYLKVDKSFSDQTYEEYRDFFVSQYIVVAVLITLCLFYLISSMILRPLKRYQTAVDSISEGGCGVNIEIMRKDELGGFAQALNTMSYEIKNKNQELEKTNKNLSEYLKAIDESVIVIRSSLNGKVTYVNKKFYEMTGYAKEEIIGSPINNLRSYGLDTDNIIDYWETLLNKFIWKEVIENVSKTGKKFYVNATVNPITDTDGEVIEFIDIWYDITEIYELKEELKLHKEHLEELVSERTKELSESHSELKSLYEESEELNKTLKLTHARMVQQEKLASIGQLAAGVAHELNNPIGFISSNFDVLRKYSEKVKAYLDTVEEITENIDRACDRSCNSDIESVFSRMREAKKTAKIDYIISDTRDIFTESEHGFIRVAGIINSLRDFSRIDIEDKSGMYDLNEGIKSTLTVAKNEIKYVADVRENLKEIPLIFCNGGEINQVLLNIIINAAYAVADSKEEGARGVIDISTDSDGESVFCVIKDSGKGIPDDIINRVFDPFFTTREPGKGTGLGLSISYDIVVNKHKGMLSVENDNGAKFTIVLPVNSLPKDDLSKEI